MSLTIFENITPGNRLQGDCKLQKNEALALKEAMGAYADSKLMV
jgi:hypothetical protein